LIEKDGYEVRLSNHVVETAMQPVGFTGMIRHQMRWARSTRISRPMGYLGLFLTYGTALALLNVAVDLASIMSVSLLLSTLVVRLTMGWIIGVHWMGDGILKKYFWLVPARDLLSFLIWCLSWVGKRVEWRGRLFEVARDGKMVLVGGASAGPTLVPAGHDSTVHILDRASHAERVPNAGGEPPPEAGAHRRL
jgi:ceramide glucosyltransferase